MYKNYEEKYAGQINNLLQENQYFLPWGDDAECCLLKIDNEKVIAVGSLWKNKMHPHREYIGMYVSPDYRRKGYGKNLYYKLSSPSKTNKFQTSVSSTDKVAIHFLQTFNFRLARRSYEIEIAPCEFEENEEIIKYSDLDSSSINELMNLHLKNYQETHREINPLNDEIKLKDWKNIITTDLNTSFSYVSVKGHSIAAYVLCYEGDQKDEIEIGYIGGKELTALNNYLPFYKTCLNELFKHFDKIYIEADDVDPFAFAVLNLFDYNTEESFDTYIL